MIWESKYWKDDLLAIANRLSGRRYRSVGELALVRTEKELMIGFYTIRKLIEAKKVSSHLENLSFDITCFPCRNPPVTLMNWHRIDRLYNLSQSSNSTKKIVQIANLFIHSYVFVVDTSNQDCLSGIFVSSDRTRNQCLYFLPITEVIRLFRKYGSNYPSRGQYVRNEQTGEFDAFLT